MGAGDGEEEEEKEAAALGASYSSHFSPVPDNRPR